MTSRIDEKIKNLKADIVIVGGGGAGLAAALAAAESGSKNVVVLEKRGTTGGTSAMASGIFAADSPAQKRQAIIARKDDLFQQAMSFTHLTVNPRIVRSFINRSADTVRWLEEKGLYFFCVPHSPIDDPLTWHVPKGNGAEIMQALAGECKNRGVEIVLYGYARKLLTGPKGNLTGVIVERDGERFTIETKSAVIATGGFGGNKELLKKFCPKYRENMRLSGLPNQGDGLLMVTDIGAATEGLGTLMIGGPFAGQAGKITLGSEQNKVPIQMVFISGEPYVIWVNKMGKRFIDETASFNYYESINALIQQPECISYALFDSSIVRMIVENGLSNVPSGFEFGERQRSPLPAGLENELRLQAEKGALKISDSWDDIADWMGAGRAVLGATIDEYNAACDRGHDPVFAKDRAYLIPLRTPPYYAVKCMSSLLNTIGGIKVNENMEVLDKQDNPVPGLYAAGVDVGGWSSDTYCAVLPGTAFGFAINSGRIAGENAFKFISGLH
jgi:fumarate reductase flavoprotein subunit